MSRTGTSLQKRLEAEDNPPGGEDDTKDGSAANCRDGLGKADLRDFIHSYPRQLLAGMEKSVGIGGALATLCSLHVQSIQPSISGDRLVLTSGGPDQIMQNFS